MFIHSTALTCGIAERARNAQEVEKPFPTGPALGFATSLPNTINRVNAVERLNGERGATNVGGR
jgi:hypothetical protein